MPFLENAFSRISPRLLSGMVSWSSRAQLESGPKEPGCSQELRDEVTEERGEVEELFFVANVLPQPQACMSRGSDRFLWFALLTPLFLFCSIPFITLLPTS